MSKISVPVGIYVIVQWCASRNRSGGDGDRPS